MYVYITILNGYIGSTCNYICFVIGYVSPLRSQACGVFTVRPDDERILLPEEQAQAFHRTTAQLLFLSQRARPDMQTLVSFLTKRARSPDEDNWKKPKRGLMYLTGTMYMKLCITVDSLSIITRYVDASYGVH